MLQLPRPHHCRLTDAVCSLQPSELAPGFVTFPKSPASGVIQQHHCRVSLSSLVLKHPCTFFSLAASWSGPGKGLDIKTQCPLPALGHHHPHRPNLVVLRKPGWDSWEAKCPAPGWALPGHLCTSNRVFCVRRAGCARQKPDRTLATGLFVISAGKFPKVPGRRRGTRGFPAAPRERPRESFFNASRGPSPLP